MPKSVAQSLIMLLPCVASRGSTPLFCLAASRQRHCWLRLGFLPDGVEALLAEPYAPIIVGLTLEDVIDHQRQAGTPLVEVSLNRWALNRDQ